MAALTKDRNTLQREGATLTLPAAAAKVFHAGALVARDASGNATPGATATTLKGMGRCEVAVDNSAGIAGAVNVSIRKGVFLYENSAAADQITRAEIGSTCYIVDDATVAKTDGTATRSPAGIVFDIDASGRVWVLFS